MQLNLLPVSEFNAPFLLAVYTSTRAAEMSVVPWSEEEKTSFLQMQLNAQHQHYLAHYPDASYQIIVLDDIPVGRLYVARTSEKIKILDITVLPEYRARGIGRKFIGEILEEGLNERKKVEIYIENFNASAEFFSRLGFQPVAEEGFHILWQWNPANEPNAVQTAAANQ